MRCPTSHTLVARSEAVSQRTLQLVATMFEKSSINCPDIPVVGKAHDDTMLAPANVSIGERPCVNGEKCLANFIAKMRHGLDTKLAFTCKEFLLPDAKAKFLKGGGLPPRRGKCLLCCRYFTNYVYLLARSDPSFVVGQSPLGLQIFCNPVSGIPGGSGSGDGGGDGGGGGGDDQYYQEDAKELPTHASLVSSKDGYKPEAMLYVDEDWASLRAAREGKIGSLMFKPTVRFCSRHYNYINDSNGLRIVQNGIGNDENSNELHFHQPAAQQVGALSAKRDDCRKLQ